MEKENIRNIAIIAHVDHGKTTLVDNLLKQAKVFAAHQAEMNQTTILDSNELERERGVTILAKNTAVEWNGYKINILDTPGHADFSGEVERVLNMADGCILLVDAAEGVLSQTRYVLKLALERGIKPIVVINKVDRKDQRAQEVLEEINTLFLELVTNTEQLDFPVLYAIGRDGIAGKEVTLNTDNSLTVVGSNNVTPLFETIIETIPSPSGELEGGFQMQVTSLDYDDYKGRYVIGRIQRGVVKKGEPLLILRSNQQIGQARVEYLYTFLGLQKQEVLQASVGDIVALTGFGNTKIGDTLTDLNNPDCLPDLPIAEPTMQIQISVSDSPFVGRDGQFTTSRQLKQRLERELERNVSLRLSPGQTGESFIVAGRGELHLSILIETMRREGYEFSVARPEVIFRTVDGVTMEPYELLTLEVPENYSGVVINAMGQRKAKMMNMQNLKTGLRFDYKISTRNLIGFRSQFLTDTSGTGLMSSLLLGYEPIGEEMAITKNGSIVSGAQGQALAYSLHNVQERGVTFIEPSTEVYTGMIIGQSSRKEDMIMNVCKGKKLTNMRSSTADISVRLAPPVIMSLEQCLNFLGPDELLEVTPIHLRLRKQNLNQWSKLH